MPTAPSAPAALPSPPPRRRTRRFAVLALVLLAVLGGGSYLLWHHYRLPAPGEPRYEEYVQAFEMGVAGLDIGVGQIAETNLSRAIELIPGEPAGWADRGLFYLRSRQYAKAAVDLRQADSLAPDNPTILSFLGMLDEQEGRFAAAELTYRRVLDKQPNDIELMYRLAAVLQKQDPLNSDPAFQQLMGRILEVRPKNLFVLATRLRMALKDNDQAILQDTLERFDRLSGDWSEDTRKEFQDAKACHILNQMAVKLPKNVQIPGLTAGLWRSCIEILEQAGDTSSLQVFANLLQKEPEFAPSANEVNMHDFEMGHPLRVFLRLDPVRRTPAFPDFELTFETKPLAQAPAGPWDAIVPVWLNAAGAPAIFVGNAKEIRRVGTDLVLPSLPLAPGGIIPLDWQNTFRTGLFLFGPKGIRFYQQLANGSFEDATGSTGLPADVVHGDYAAAIAADYDLDGDLDLILGLRTGSPLLLRNNLDGSFTAQPIFPEASGVRVFAWADLDSDGDGDAAMLDAEGRLHLYVNERSGRFKPWPFDPPKETQRLLALAVFDGDNDGAFDLALLREDGALCRLSERRQQTSWDYQEFARWDAQGRVEPGSIRLLFEDLDNNGLPDMIATSRGVSAAWLTSSDQKYARLEAVPPANIFAAADLGEGSITVLALDAQGKPIQARAVGTKNYHWQTIRFHAELQANMTGDNRINSYGIGGEIEIRSGSLIVKRPIASPSVHFGLGERTVADVIRIQWPNGTTQIEFQPAPDQSFAPVQRLKGSCPFLFTWNGERFEFVTDILWSSPLGLYINAQHRGGIGQTTEWVKVRGDQLVPRDGHYEVRVQANLWETHFFDHLALQVIDHPEGTELFSDERFVLEPTAPSFHLTGPLSPVARAVDHLGKDATTEVKAIDGVYLDRAGRGRYQGITNEHWVEVDLGDDAPKSGPLWFLARGWVHPTDSSVNFAIDQGKHDRPHGLVLEAPDGRGGWKVLRDTIGFPAGKNKTVPIRLDGLDGPGVLRRFRLRTNMEIYWDALQYAVGRDDSEVSRSVLLPKTADLRTRGILAMTQANRSSPELPDYDRVVSRGQVWRDLIGFHTRFGDVRELLEKTDDRYAILTAGDEIALKFEAPPGPRPGWKRDFIWVSDGWEKDGDFNTRHGKTVLPLPYHGMPSYDLPSGRLADDPVYRKHAKDWDVYHTRYVTPAGFTRGLRPLRP